MNKSHGLAALAIFLACGGAGIASDYKAEYAELKEKVGTDKLRAYLTEWRKREPENPDAYIHSANWALESATGLNISGKNGKPLSAGTYDLKLDNGEIVAVGRDGRRAGTIGSGGSSAPGTLEAAAYLTEALKRWPHRTDIHCGLATVYARGKLWKEHVAALQAFAVAAEKNAGKLRWCHDEPLEGSEPEFIADKLHSFAVDQFEMENKQADERFRQITELLIHTCPKSPKGYNDMAVYHGLTKNWKAAQSVLEKAAEVAPDDALVWMNLGDNSKRLRKTDAARKCYEKVLELKPDQELREAAIGALKSID